MKISEAYKKALHADAQAIGLVILSLGFGERRASGFFMHGLTTHDVVKRILATKKPASSLYFAAMDYQRRHQALLDNTDMKVLSYNPYARKRFDSVEKTLSDKLLDLLVTSYASTARAEIERKRRECMKARRKKLRNVAAISGA